MIDPNLPDGFYWLTGPEQPVALVRLYSIPSNPIEYILGIKPTDPDKAIRGVGFGMWDEPGFIPLQDLKEECTLTLAVEDHPNYAGTREALH